MKQIPLAITSEATRTFDNFVTAANRPAVEHLRHLERLAAGAAPTYLWGPPGSGKTHLLNALAGRFEEQGGRVGCFSAQAPAPWPHDESWALIVFDACEALDAEQQQAAFALFVESATRGVPILAAGRVPPVDLPLREDLRTRLGWGHVFALTPLAEGDARAALRREADSRGVFFSDDVMNHLLTRFNRDLGHLMTQIDRLDRFSVATKRPITVPLLKQMLADEGSSS